MVVRASVDIKGEVIVFRDETEYEYPLKRVELLIEIPGYSDPQRVNIETNQVNIIHAERFNLRTFPDGEYSFLFLVPECEFTIRYFNTWDLQTCINHQLSTLLGCASCSVDKIDKKKKEVIDQAILQREAAKLLDCNAVEHYQAARKLVCKDC
jgi:hypothetical protein